MVNGIVNTITNNFRFPSAINSLFWQFKLAVNIVVVAWWKFRQGVLLVIQERGDMVWKCNNWWVC